MKRGDQMTDGDIKLTPEMIKREIDEIESSDFYLQMKDHWSNDDFRIHDTYQKRIKELREKLKEMEEKG
jgi:rRNA maturation endonuclease Nob1